MSFEIADLLERYRSGLAHPGGVIEQVIASAERFVGHNIWISRVAPDVLRQRAAALAKLSPHSLPLYGIPFAIKDNIDYAGLPTTAACPAFSYRPTASAFVVQQLEAAGAIVVGKTNLDQFATGLVGTRSPYGVCHNSFDPAYISGGSSSGSSVAVALGVVSFALGTDTAGSGRVPAAFNNLIGYKPTLGRISTQGVVPACQTLDAVSIFALTAEDAKTVADVAGTFNAADAWAREPQLSATRGWSQRDRFHFAVPSPEQLTFFGDAEYARLFARAAAQLEELGGTKVQVDIEPLLEAARLLYEGPWIAERYLAARTMLAQRPVALLDVTRRIIEQGEAPHAYDAFSAQYGLQELKRAARAIWQRASVLLLPTAGSHFSIAEVEAQPVVRNTDLGRYTNFVNLLDYAAIAVPSGFTSRGLPFGVSLIATAWQDEDLLHMAARMQRRNRLPLGATGSAAPLRPVAAPTASADYIDIAVCGAHMEGLPLNSQLTERGAWRISSTTTAPLYQLVALPGGPPRRPGLVRCAQGGASIAVEVWRMPAERFGDFMALIPAPLGIGKVTLQDDSTVAGFLCEAWAAAQGTDISKLGGWRQFLASL